MNKEKLYICTKDFQYGDFAVGNIATAKEWGEITYGWADSDDWDNPKECLLENFENEQELINFIQDMWEIEILEVNKNNKEVIEFLKDNNNFNSYQIEKAQKVLKDLGVI